MPREQTCSAGIVQVQAEDTLETVVERADAALHAAKAAGRDRVVLEDLARSALGYARSRTVGSAVGYALGGQLHLTH